MLEGILQSLEHTEVHRALHLGWVTPDLACAELDRNRAARADRPQRLWKPAIGEQRRVDAMRQCAQFVERLLDLTLELAEERHAALRILADQVLGELELDPQRDQPLLRAVM